MPRMQTNAPARKVVGSTVAAALSTVVIWAIEASLATDVPGAVEAAISTIMVFLAGYFTPPASVDTIVE